MVSLLIVVILAALVFDFINGFHDTANAIATSVSTGVLPIRTAVIVAGVFNVIGALTGTAVAKTIASGFADPAVVTQTVVLSALLGASGWNLITWWFGIPSSSSHALVGGLCGAVVAHAGLQAFTWSALVGKVLIPLVVSPVLGLLVAFLLMVVLMWILRRSRPDRVNRGARRMQLLSACSMAFSHGSNDAQKVMGIITLALVSFMVDHDLKPLITARDGVPAPATEVALHQQAVTDSRLPATMKRHEEWMLPRATIDTDAKSGKKSTNYGVPTWAMLACALIMGAGTMAGGKKIIKTMGTKIIKITPLQGFASETAGAATIFAASHLGIPVSTTHVISASVMGAGASKSLSAVRWGVATNIVVAWVLTIPLSAAIAWGIKEILGLILPPGF